MSERNRDGKETERQRGREEERKTDIRAETDGNGQMMRRAYNAKKLGNSESPKEECRREGGEALCMDL